MCKKGFMPLIHTAQSWDQIYFDTVGAKKVKGRFCSVTLRKVLVVNLNMRSNLP